MDRRNFCKGLYVVPMIPFVSLDTTQENIGYWPTKYEFFYENSNCGCQYTDDNDVHYIMSAQKQAYIKISIEILEWLDSSYVCKKIPYKEYDRWGYSGFDIGWSVDWEIPKYIKSKISPRSTNKDFLFKETYRHIMMDKSKIVKKLIKKTIENKLMIFANAQKGDIIYFSEFPRLFEDPHLIKSYYFGCYGWGELALPKERLRELYPNKKEYLV